MKRSLFPLALVLVMAIGCKKDKEEATPATYMPNTANSSWTYDTKTTQPTASTGSYTLKATNKDTLINGRTYRVYTNTSGQNDYYAQVGSDYYQLGNIGDLGSQRVELLYLKDVAAGTTWSETQSVTLTGLPLPINVPVNYQIVKKDYDTTIATKAYKSVTHVKVSLGNIVFLGSTIVPTSDIHFYYARGVGRVYTRSKVIVNATVLAMPINVNVDNEASLNTYTIQ